MRDLQILQAIVERGRAKAKPDIELPGKVCYYLDTLADAAGIPLTDSVKLMADRSACDYIGPDGRRGFWFETERPLPK